MQSLKLLSGLKLGKPSNEKNENSVVFDQVGVHGHFHGCWICPPMHIGEKSMQTEINSKLEW